MSLSFELRNFLKKKGTMPLHNIMVKDKKIIYNRVYLQLLFEH